MSAVYRCIPINIWSDKKVLFKFSPDDKLMWIYLLTNSETTLSGCYTIKIDDVSIDLGFNVETVKLLINRLEKEHNVIKTARINNEKIEVLILNWGKYNWTASAKQIAGARYSAENIITPEFKEYVLSKIEEKAGKKNGKVPKIPELPRVEQKEPEPKRVVEDWQSWPELGEVMDYAELKGFKRYVGKSFYYYHDRNGWKDADGNPIKDWKKYFDACAENGSIGSEVG